MKRNKQSIRQMGIFIILVTLLFFITIWNINTGNVKIPVSRILKILFLGTEEVAEYNIIWKIRLPRILMSGLLGGALALSGFLLQTFFGNPIAGPFILGISSGAKLTVALAMIGFLGYFHRVSSYLLIAAAFVGALISTGFVLLFSKKIKGMATLLVAGTMIGYICSAVTDFIITFADDSDIVNLHNWSKGSFSGMNWNNVQVTVVVVGLTFLCTFLLSKPIGAYQLGEVYAQSMGVNIKRFRVALILLSSVFSACVTAFAGPISFVGIAVPYLMKGCMKTAKPLVMIPATFLGGAVFCMGCDLIARMAFAPTELNISTVTSIFGAPVVIYMMISRKGGR